MRSIKSLQQCRCSTSWASPISRQLCKHFSKIGERAGNAKDTWKDCEHKQRWHKFNQELRDTLRDTRAQRDQQRPTPQTLTAPPPMIQGPTPPSSSTQHPLALGGVPAAQQGAAVAAQTQGFGPAPPTVAQGAAARLLPLCITTKRSQTKNLRKTKEQTQSAKGEQLASPQG